MMRWNSFARTLVFGAVAAATLIVAAELLVPPLRLTTLLELYFAAAASVYVAGIAPTRRRGIAIGTLAAALGGLVVLLPIGVHATAAGAALVIAVCRSAFLHRAPALRALVLECALSIGGLALAGFLASRGVSSVALGVWGYFLVQSLFFLVGGAAPRMSPAEVDPFDLARARLLALFHE